MRADQPHIGRCLGEDSMKTILTGSVVHNINSKKKRSQMPRIMVEKFNDIGNNHFLQDENVWKKVHLAFRR